MRKLILLVLVLSSTGVFAKAQSPSGYWQQINDKTQQPQSILQLGQTADGKLWGKILGLYPVEGRELAKYCEKCTDDRKDQPIIGMTIIREMSQVEESSTWAGGEILDPKAGSLYRCKLILSQDNRTLEVRGYLGIPLLGRSQTWHRLDANEAKQILSKIKSKA